MRLDKFIEELQELEGEHGHLDVITSMDDEGNGFSHIFFSPSLQHIDKDGDLLDGEEPNCICVN